MADYDAQGQATLNKWAREEERKKAKAEALSENFKETFANTLKSVEVKKSLAREAKEATQNRNNRDAMFDLASHGTSRGYDDYEVITGHEPRPWEE